MLLSRWFHDPSAREARNGFGAFPPSAGWAISTEGRAIPGPAMTPIATMPPRVAAVPEMIRRDEQWHEVEKSANTIPA